MIRVKHVKNLNITDLISAFIKDNKYSHGIIGEEHVGLPTYHLQGFVAGDEITDVSVRQTIKDVYPDAVGNKCLYVKYARDKKQSQKYVVKEGLFEYFGYTSEFIDKIKILSTPKENMKKKIIENEEQLLMRQISWRRFMENYVDIVIDHNQNIRDHVINSYFKKMKLKCGRMSTSEYLERYHAELYN